MSEQKDLVSGNIGKWIAGGIVFLIIIIMIINLSLKTNIDKNIYNEVVISANIHRIYFDVADRECRKVSDGGLSYISYVKDVASKEQTNVQNAELKFTCEDGTSWKYEYQYDIIP